MQNDRILWISLKIEFGKDSLLDLGKYETKEKNRVWIGW